MNTSSGPNASNPISLKFVVVGAGLSGLATAYALRRAGHEVLVLEKSEGVVGSPCGVRSSPNMTKVLLNWGLGDQLEELTLSLGNTPFLNADTGDMIGVLTPNVVKQICSDLDTKAEFLMLKHGALIDLLFGVAKQEGVTFRFNSAVKSVCVESGTVFLEDGDQLSTDLIVGADGSNSPLRRHLEDDEDDAEAEAAEHPTMIICLAVAAEDLKNDEELFKFTEKEEWTVWLGEGVLISGHPHRGPAGKDYTVVITYPFVEPDIPEKYRHWQSFDDISPFGVDLSKTEPRVQRLVSMAKHSWGQIFICRPCLSGSSEGKLVLVGEAFHSIAPGGYLSTAMSFEDAHILGNLFSMIQHKSQVPRFLTAYDEIRHSRSSWTQLRDSHHQMFLRLPPGPMRDLRDEAYRHSLEEGKGEEEMAMLYQDDIKLYAYDPAVETAAWWNQYGSMVLSSTERRNSALEISIAERTATHE